MNLRFSSKMCRAQAVINLLQSTQDNVELEEINAFIEAYCNGREQGYHIIFNNYYNGKRLRVSFSECRNTDEIVVYYSKDFGAFSMQGNVPNEETYNKKVFCHDEIQAAKFILGLVEYKRKSQDESSH